MSIDLRPYDDSDEKVIAALLRAHGWAEQYVTGQLDAAATLAASENGATLVAAADGSLAGFVAIELHSWNGLAQLQALAVPDEPLLRRRSGWCDVREVLRVGQIRFDPKRSESAPADSEPVSERVG